MNRREAGRYLSLYSEHATLLMHVYDDDPDLRAAIQTLMPDPEFEYLDWSCRPVGALWLHTRKPRRLTVPAHCMDEDFLREIDKLGVKIVNLQDAPWNVTFEGTAAALREMYETLWGDPEPCPEFDKEEA